MKDLTIIKMTWRILMRSMEQIKSIITTPLKTKTSYKITK